MLFSKYFVMFGKPVLLPIVWDSAITKNNQIIFYERGKKHFFSKPITQGFY